MKFRSSLAFGFGSAVLLCSAFGQAPERMRWTKEAATTTIVRDDWGIAHVHGKTDADAVFGMVYAQCEDDFNRVETNYLVSLGRLAEAEGDSAIWQDLRQRLFIDPEDLKKQYEASPKWLRKLMDAWAVGLNFYLAKHPEVKPRAITHFEPWMALSFTEGSIGGDIEKVNLQSLRAFYDRVPSPHAALSSLFPIESYLHPDSEEPGGSNGFAIAPSNTANHHALLLINPHTSFFFRSELQMTSDEGLNAYGAATWGQPFIYQGFNDRAGWMHTSSNVDAVDEYRETLVPKPMTPGAVSHSAPEPSYAYRYGAGTREFVTKAITLRFKTTEGMKGADVQCLLHASWASHSRR